MSTAPAKRQADPPSPSQTRFAKIPKTALHEESDTNKPVSTDSSSNKGKLRKSTSVDIYRKRKDSTDSDEAHVVSDPEHILDSDFHLKSPVKKSSSTELKTREAIATAVTPTVGYYVETPCVTNDQGKIQNRTYHTTGPEPWSSNEIPTPPSKNGGQYSGVDGQDTASTMYSKPGSSVSDGFKGWSVGKRYRLIKILGHGSYGEVAQAEDLECNNFVAIKRINQVFDQEVDTKRILREVYILRRMENPHVIRLLNIVTPPKEDFNEIYLVFEFVDTDLHKLINSPQYLSVEHIQTFLYQLLCALKYIHSARVIHRDVKPANILLNEDCALKVCDFGLARVIGSHVQDSEVNEGTNEDRVIGTQKIGASPMQPPKKKLTRQLTKHVVTRWYRPPELILLQEYANSVDVWSVGCIFAELLSMQKESVKTFKDRQPLFPGKSCFPLSADNDRTYKDQLDQLNVIFDVIGTPAEEDLEHLGEVQHYLRTLPSKNAINFADKYSGAPATAIDLLNRILVFNPEKRINVDDALAHPFLETVRRKDLEKTSKVRLEIVEEMLNLDQKKLMERLKEEVDFFKNKA